MNHVFGYGHLEAWFCERFRIDPELLAEQNNWICERGVLVHAFSKNNAPRIEFGTSLTKNELARIARDDKKKQNERTNRH